MDLKRALSLLLTMAMLSGCAVTAAAETAEPVDTYTEVQQREEPAPEYQESESFPQEDSGYVEETVVVSEPEDPVVEEEPVHNLDEGTEPAPSGEETPAPETSESPDGTEAPAVTDAPADVEAPTQTEEVTPTPEPERSEIRVSASGSGSVKVGEQAAFKFSVVHASAVEFRLLVPDGTVLASGEGQNGEGQYTFTPTVPGRYTMTVSGFDVNGEALGASAALDVTALTELYVDVNAPIVCYGGDPVTFDLSMTRDAELAYCGIFAYQNGDEFWRTDAFAQTVTVVPPVRDIVTNVTLTVEVMDIYGRKANASATVPCAVHDRETRAEWEATMADVQLTGVWPEDLLAIAWSQVGYVESAIDFGEKHGGGMSGYTRYGDWVGMPYEEWCAMFCSFCLHYAGIPKEAFDRASNCQRWIKALTPRGLYAPREEYTPKPGDLVFFDWQNNNDSDHVGIVYDLERDPEGNIVAIWTIEGNSSGGAVTCDDRYDIDDVRVVGYGLVNEAYDRLIEAQPGKLTAEYEDYAVTASFQPEAGIPARAFLSVREILQGGEEFDAVSSALSGALLEAGQGVASSARFLDIGIVDEWGEPVETQAPVSVTVTFQQDMGQDGAMTPGVAYVRGSSATVDRSVGFIRDSWSTTFSYQAESFGNPTAFFLSGQLEGRKGSMSAADGDMDVKLAYGAKAGLPKGVEVSLRVIRSGDAEYESLLNQLRRSAEIPEGAFVRLCEIELTYNGIAMDPARDIKVEINCLKDAADARLVRLNDGKAMNIHFYRRKSGRSATRFTTSRLGVFAVVYGKAED